MIIDKIAIQLQKDLNNADEIWVAVALLNLPGLNFVRNNLKETCKENYIVGVDLPTHPAALSELFKFHLRPGFQAKIFSEEQYFHPKLYLIRNKRKFVAFIGSANCTNGGLNSNVELSFRITDFDECEKILNWFNKINLRAKPITKKFLEDYNADYAARKQRKDIEERTAKKQKAKLEEELAATFSERIEFVRVLRNYKKSQNHDEVVRERKSSVKKMRRLLDYPNFEPDKIDVDEFFRIPALGHIIAIPKPTIKREIIKFSNQLKMLCDDKIDISERYNRAISGDLEMRGVKKGLVTKILTIHNPEKYFVENDKTLNALDKYGIEFPRGLNKGDKYKITLQVLKDICEQVELENFAVLDYYLYLEG